MGIMAYSLLWGNAGLISSTVGLGGPLGDIDALNKGPFVRGP